MADDDMIVMMTFTFPNVSKHNAQKATSVASIFLMQEENQSQNCGRTRSTLQIYDHVFQKASCLFL